MKKRLLIFFTLSLSTFFYGIVVGKYEVFPYQLIKILKNKATVVDNSKSPMAYEKIRLFKHFSPKADVAFIGDSITYAGRWSEFFPYIRVVNRGVGGDKTSDILSRLDSVLSTEPTRAYLMIGINDINQNVSISNVLENYALIVDALLGADIEVTIQSTIQCEITKCGLRHVNAINDLNKSLFELSLSKGVSFLSLGELSRQEGLDIKYTIDGIHLTAEGYIYWVEKIAPSLNF